MLKLPLWVIPDKFSAKYDIESATPLEMTGKLYAKMNELIESYNKWVQEVNKSIEEYESANNKDYNCFTQTIVKLTSDYIGMLDLKTIQHDRKFDEYYKSFTSEIVKTVEIVVSDLKANGELNATILEAVGELKSKFEEFKASIQTSVLELKAANENFKADILKQNTDFEEEMLSLAQGLETDYQNTKLALAEDYQNVKANIQSTIESAIALKHTDTLLFRGNEDGTAPSVIFNPLQGVFDESLGLDYDENVVLAFDPKYRYFEVVVDDYSANGGRSVLCTARIHQNENVTFLHIVGNTTYNISPISYTTEVYFLSIDVEFILINGKFCVHQNDSTTVRFLGQEGNLNIIPTTIYEIIGVE